MKWAPTIVAALALSISTPGIAQLGGYGLAGLQLAVTNDARSIKFYTVLGMKPGRVPHPGHQEMNWGGKPGEGPSIMLVHKDASNPMIPGTASLILFVPDLVKTVKELQADGFANIPDVKLRANAPRPPAGQPDFAEHRIQDPDGNAILLIGPTPR